MMLRDKFLMGSEKSAEKDKLVLESPTDSMLTLDKSLQLTQSVKYMRNKKKRKSDIEDWYTALPPHTPFSKRPLIACCSEFLE